MRVCFETFGCRLNRAEALEEEAKYLARGWEVTSRHEDADLIVVRGCSVTARAQRDCERLIAHLKTKYPLKRVLVTGCLPTADKTYQVRGVATEPAVPVRTARAYLKIQDGCSGKCTFCIVPKFRGASRSVPFAEVLDRAKRFLDAGYHEIVLTGCNLSLYASEGKRLPDLLATLADLAPQSLRLRLGSLEPGEAAFETLDVMEAHENVCRFLHIPIQSGSNAILMKMHRPYLIHDVTRLLSSIHERFPRLGLGCDLMTGFPGESEIDFLSTKGLLKRFPISNAHIFPYSERPGTPAAAFADAVPHDIRHDRAHELSDIASRNRRSAAERFVGHTASVLIEDAEKLTGWTGEYFACTIEKSPRTRSISRKDLVRVRITAARDDRLKAVLAS